MYYVETQGKQFYVIDDAWGGGGGCTCVIEHRGGAAHAQYGL